MLIFVKREVLVQTFLSDDHLCVGEMYRRSNSKKPRYKHKERISYFICYFISLTRRDQNMPQTNARNLLTLVCSYIAIIAIAEKKVQLFPQNARLLPPPQCSNQSSCCIWTYDPWGESTLGWEKRPCWSLAPHKEDEVFFNKPELFQVSKMPWSKQSIEENGTD